MATIIPFPAVEIRCELLENGSVQFVYAVSQLLRDLPACPEVLTFSRNGREIHARIGGFALCDDLVREIPYWLRSFPLKGWTVHHHGRLVACSSDEPPYVEHAPTDEHESAGSDRRYSLAPCDPLLATPQE